MRSLLIIIAFLTTFVNALRGPYTRNDLLKIYEMEQANLKQELILSGVETIVDNVLDSAKNGLTTYVVLDKSPGTYTEIKQEIFDTVRTIFPDSDVSHNASDNTYSITWAKPDTYHIPGIMAPIHKKHSLR